MLSQVVLLYNFSRLYYKKPVHATKLASPQRNPNIKAMKTMPDKVMSCMVAIKSDLRYIFIVPRLCVFL